MRLIPVCCARTSCGTPLATMIATITIIGAVLMCTSREAKPSPANGLVTAAA